MAGSPGSVASHAAGPWLGRPSTGFCDVVTGCSSWPGKGCPCRLSHASCLVQFQADHVGRGEEAQHGDLRGVGKVSPRPRFSGRIARGQRQRYGPAQPDFPPSWDGQSVRGRPEVSEGAGSSEGRAWEGSLVRRSCESGCEPGSGRLWCPVRRDAGDSRPRSITQQALGDGGPQATVGCWVPSLG